MYIRWAMQTNGYLMRVIWWLAGKEGIHLGICFVVVSFTQPHDILQYITLSGRDGKVL